MMYKIILNKTEVIIDEEDKDKIVANIDKSFILLKSGEVINPSFVQGIIIDCEATRQEATQLKMENNMKRIEAPAELSEEEARKMFGKYKPDF